VGSIPIARSNPQMRGNSKPEIRISKLDSFRISAFGFRVFRLERYRSGQTGQTVNLLAYAFGGSNPPLSTIFRVQVNTTLQPPTLGRDITNPLVLDVLILVCLSLLALAAFYVTPEFAANLPQDAVDFAVPTVNLLERGQLVLPAYGHDFPPARGFGMALLLMPAYVFYGHFLGNGIYAILLCALGTIAVTYFIGVKLGGRWCGCFAALFLITNYGFWQYAQKIMTDVPSAFLTTAVLALLLSIRDWKRPGLACFVVGAVMGFAVSIRYDNILAMAPALLLLWEGSRTERFRRVIFVILGLAPWMISLAVYHQIRFGSPLRTGYSSFTSSAKDLERATFSTKYIATSSFLKTRGIEPRFAGMVEGNGPFYAKSLLTEADTSRVFGHPLYWQLPGRTIYQVLTLLRTALGVLGLLVCLRVWRSNHLRQRFLVWLVVFTLMNVSLYLLYFWGEERYLMRLVPLFCVANGIGVSELFARWPAKAIRAALVIVFSAFIAAFAFYNWQMGFPTGNDLHLYETLTQAARQMETNAVVVTNFDPWRSDAYLIRGTQRLAVPLMRADGVSLFVRGASTLTPFHPFVASEDPERLRELLVSGRPVYWLINNPWSGRPLSDLNTLEKSFRLQVLATANVNGNDELPYFGRVSQLAPKP
jgi:4-amino-4-deoxy-L-arabinose transferase-like glycosyltransferase